MFETYPCHCAQDLVIILLYEHFAGKKGKKQNILPVIQINTGLITKNLQNILQEKKEKTVLV